MGLNIKNERVHALAREAANRTGQSQTSVVAEALTRLLEDLDRRSKPDERRRIALDIAVDFERRLDELGEGELSSDWMYDDRGLPA